MLRTRLLVALVGLPVVLAVILAGGLVFHLVAALLLAIGGWELVRLARREGFRVSYLIALAALLVVLAAVRWPDVLGPGLCAVLLADMLVVLYQFQRGDPTPLNTFTLPVGIGLLLGWLGSRLVMLRLLPDGAWWTLLVLFTTFAADTGAYAVGVQFGRHKLAPRASPKKTWEGYFGGVLAGALFGLLVGALAASSLPGLTAAHGLALGLLIAVITPVGDLTISSFKRQANVKDASKLIPGHGGMMDRLDTVLLSAALGYYYILYFV